MQEWLVVAGLHVPKGVPGEVNLTSKEDVAKPTAPPLNPVKSVPAEKDPPTGPPTSLYPILPVSTDTGKKSEPARKGTNLPPDTAPGRPAAQRYRLL